MPVRSQSIEEMRQGEKIGGDWHSRNCLEKLCSFSFFHVSRGCLKLTTVAVTSFENDHLLYFFNKKIFSLSCIGKYDEVVRLTAPLPRRSWSTSFFWGDYWTTLCMSTMYLNNVLRVINMKIANIYHQTTTSEIVHIIVTYNKEEARLHSVEFS